MKSIKANPSAIRRRFDLTFKREAVQNWLGPSVLSTVCTYCTILIMLVSSGCGTTAEYARIQHAKASPEIRVLEVPLPDLEDGRPRDGEQRGVTPPHRLSLTFSTGTNEVLDLRLGVGQSALRLLANSRVSFDWLDRSVLNHDRPGTISLTLERGELLCDIPSFKHSFDLEIGTASGVAGFPVGWDRAQVVVRDDARLSVLRGSVLVKLRTYPILSTTTCCDGGQSYHPSHESEGRNGLSTNTVQFQRRLRRAFKDFSNHRFTESVWAE